MSYQVLARKYRPQRFSEVIGQDHVTRTLKNAIELQRIAHGYIFSGHRGIGKTTIARILAMCLNCHGADGHADRPQSTPCGVCASCRAISSSSRADADSLSFEETHSLNYEEIDAATNRGIDEARRIIDKVNKGRPAGKDRYRIIVLDEAHQLTDAAFNSILKTLEEPPSWAIFMMATTQPEDIPQTIRSRCQNFSFHAVKFDDIVGQLRAICEKESIEADDDALAVLAEAGDGSMRDALSIMDQAIACCGSRLTGELVLGLVGSVSSQVLEELMGTVARSSSDEALRLLDRLMTEGQNPAHFAKQLVKFLRNSLVAKVSSPESSLLQISSDERHRVGRIALQFSEEDLARFLQIMLRTFDELGYRQEQRFHLELGVLKMVHAQRILPLEQVLSQLGALPASGPVARASLPAGRTSLPSSPSGAAGGAQVRPQSATQEKVVSPFEADRVRKSRSFDPEMSASQSPAVAVTAMASPGGDVETNGAYSSNGVHPINGSARPDDTPAAIAVREETSTDAGTVLGHVLVELENNGHKMLASMLESGSAVLQSAELSITVTQSASMIGVVMGQEQKQIANAAASRAAGRLLKVNVVSGLPANGASTVVRPVRVRDGATARSRAANDPVVQRMMEKFGAEIRTVIDHREKD
ncbi:MAG TPA: DNA polymerase III subunit gamma/tau [Candidatus Angelobacter sp.]|jgi:DNA polymerase-3 subunit gamma/tau|nr:DNA polymerase III subunit gamma/tau [Candidatus Angelobacter sp.]